MNFTKALPLLAAVALSLPEAASAAPVTFTFHGPESATMSYEVGGISFISSEADNGIEKYDFHYPSEIGLYLSAMDTTIGVSEFSFQFGTNVYLLGYSVASVYEVSETETFSITGGLVSSSGHQLWEVGEFDLAVPLAFEADQEYTFQIAGFTGEASVYLESFVVDTIPEPSSVMLLGAGAAAAAFLGYRRRKA